MTLIFNNILASISILFFVICIVAVIMERRIDLTDRKRKMEVAKILKEAYFYLNANKSK